MSDQDINDLLKLFDNPCHCYPLNVVEAIRLLVRQRDEARLEIVDALKAHDPLAEMWRELAEYQPQADRDGHGESWRRMCEEHTGGSALAASRAATASVAWAWEAARAAAWAASWAGPTASWAAQSIAAIRHAKEGQR